MAEGKDGNPELPTHLQNKLNRLEELAQALDRLGLDPLLREGQVADIVNMSVAWLQRKRHKGGGISFVKIESRTVRYRLSAVRAWMKNLEERNFTI